MKNKTIYTNEPMGKVRVVMDFLPSPEQLAFKRESQGNNFAEPGQP